MNKKIIFHLFKHGIKLKKDFYFFSIIGLIVVIIYETLASLYIFPSYVGPLLLMISAISFVPLVIQSSIIPSSNKFRIKGQATGYSASYIFSTLNNTKNIVASIALEVLLDSSLISIGLYIYKVYALNEIPSALSLIFPGLMFFKMLFLISSTATIKSRTTSLRHTKKSKAYSVLVISGMLITFFALDNFSIQIPDALLAYLLVFFAIWCLIHFPFWIYTSISSDYNKLERKKAFLHHLPSAILVLVISCSCFYFRDVKTGKLVFDYIDKSNMKKIEELLKNKDIMKLKDIEHNLTPLLYSAYTNKPEVAKKILSMGGDINERSKEGLNLLDYSTSNCNYVFAEYLVSKGIEINNVSNKNTNALFIASANNCLPLIMYFKKLKMNEKLINSEGQNFVQYGFKENSYFKNLFTFLNNNKLFRD